MLKKVVTIGGGTGNMTVLTGLKKYPIDISAIVSMADDGGSTGVLRDELGVLPPGDVRQCLVALSESQISLRRLFNYRFEKGTLAGHSFGNLFLSAMEKISGDFNTGLEEAIKILKVKGKVIPVTSQNARLFMEIDDNKILKGEQEINHYPIQKTKIKKFYFNPEVSANPKAIQSIREADLISIGPGNYFCSIIPNFLVKGIKEAIMKSKARVVLNCNLVNKKDHTENYTLDDYVSSLNKYLGGERIDYVTFNTKKPDDKLIKKYEHQKELLVEYNQKNRGKRSYKIIKANLLSNKIARYSHSDKLARQRSFIRHNSDYLAKILLKILENKV